MRNAGSLIVLAAALAAGSQPARQAQSGPTPAVPVVVELFTSEGCSSCPPADALLSKLANEQPVPGVQVIALGMHVTYWDQLGWKDSASLTLATERQRSYSRVFGEDRVYTPQAVIDGHAELVGSDERGVREAIAKAAMEPHARLAVERALEGDTLDIAVTIAQLPRGVDEPLEMKLALTESGLMSIVKRGENGGRTLHHDGVVRSVLDTTVVAGQPLTFHARLRPEWRRDRLSAVALLQGKKTQRIWGAAAVSLK